MAIKLQHRFLGIDPPFLGHPLDLFQIDPTESFSPFAPVPAPD